MDTWVMRRRRRVGLQPSSTKSSAWRPSWRLSRPLTQQWNCGRSTWSYHAIKIDPRGDTSPASRYFQLRDERADGTRERASYMTAVGMP
jgi:hypothetical protein